MAGFGHAALSAADDDTPATASRNARIGLWLFAFYFLIYGGYVLLNAFWPASMSQTLAGLNVAILYGMLLIVLAFVLAVVYGWLCRAPVADRTKEPA
jgi:uncharacterized membrane protein (DUF485 family)